MNPFPFAADSLAPTPISAASALATLPAPLAAWFSQRFGEPTEAQRLAWPVLAPTGTHGGHLLLSAPTGMGKTLAAWMPLLAEMWDTTESEPTSGLRVLMVAPLKALVNDTARNLTRDLDDLAETHPGRLLPTVATRTGDTPPAERKRQRETPPDVLLTTPESLAVLLTRPDAEAFFATVRWLVVDEVHAFAGTKRGADLALSLERVAEMASSVAPVGGTEPRRIGLSATATPLDQAARFLVGQRPCSIVCVGSATTPELRLEPLPDGERFLAAVVRRLADEIPRHRSTLVFTNTRNLCERLAWALRRHAPALDGRIAVHHSALSAARRRDTETRLKRGELAAVVCSTSLELGIDIGGVDLAVLVHPPGDVIRLLQRVGRAGHEPGGVRRGLVLTATAAELLEAAVTLASARSGQCEALPVLRPPLDLLTQHLLAACCVRSREADELFALARRTGPYADLTREDFDACLRYLRGVDPTDRSWLPARIKEDADLWRVRDERTVRILRRNLGTILAERTVPVLQRRDDERLSVGEIDEAFAERLTPGDRFLLDGRCLEFRQLDEGAALVDEVPGRPRVPRWGGDGWPLSAELSQRLYLLRCRAAEALREGRAALHQLLADEYALPDDAVTLLADYFEAQETSSEIPDATTLLVEEVNVGFDTEYYLHTPLNRTANDALARVALRRIGQSATSQVADLGLMLKLRGREPHLAERLREWLAPEGFREEHEAALAQSDAVRLRFGRVAVTGLMVLRNPLGRPRKVGGTGWAGRELFDRLRRRDPSFVLLRQALRETADEVSDATTALAYVQTLAARTIRVRTLGQPSPFARTWTQSEPGPTEEPLSPADALKRLHAELMNTLPSGG
jgi:ATP-dependent Lhr-like helicase